MVNIILGQCEQMSDLCLNGHHTKMGPQSDTRAKDMQAVCSPRRMPKSRCADVRFSSQGMFEIRSARLKVREPEKKKEEPPCRPLVKGKEQEWPKVKRGMRTRKAWRGQGKGKDKKRLEMTEEGEGQERVERGERTRQAWRV